MVEQSAPALFNPLDHGLRGFPLMISAVDYNRLRAENMAINMQLAAAQARITSLEADNKAAWATNRAIEVGRQDEMRKRDAAQAETVKIRAVLARLLTAALDLLKSINDEAKAKMSFDNAESNFTNSRPEEIAYGKAQIKAAESSNALRKAIESVKAAGVLP